MIQFSRALLLALTCWLGTHAAAAQTPLQIKLSPEGDRYVQFSGLNQVWLRHTRLNPGSQLNGRDMGSHYTDLSLRRLRFQVLAQLTDRVFFYTQFGQNNFNFRSPKYTGAFFHDATVEYALMPKKLSLGGGLAGWTGLARHAAPGIGAIMSLDVPLFLQPTNGITDQFIRKLGLYAKGQVGRVDYRIIISHPMTVSGAPDTTSLPTSRTFNYAHTLPKMQSQAYVKYFFRDGESNLTPYQAGSYLGQKNMLNLGAGFIYQPDAFWALDAAGQTQLHPMLLLGLDLFYEKPLNTHTSITFYTVFTHYDMGRGHIRSLGVDNPASGMDQARVSGPGNGFPIVGTGNTLYAQAGYLFGNDLLGTGGKLQPFAAAQYSRFLALADPMLMYELGLNYLTQGHHGSKLSLEYQGRPTYTTGYNGENQLHSYKGMWVMQYQVSF